MRSDKAALRVIRKYVQRWSCVRTIPLVLVLLICAFLSYRYHVMLYEDRDLVDHTYEVITSIEALFIEIQDAETGQRGYIITGDPAYLDPYENALRHVPASVARLRLLIADSPAQLELCRTLETTLSVKLTELGHTIAVRRERGFETARAVILRSNGKQSMDAIRAVIADMQSAESKLLKERWVRARQAERRIIIVALLGVALSFATRGAIALLVPRWRKHRRRKNQRNGTLDST